MNSVNLIGILKDPIDDYFRYFEYELPYSDDPLKPTPRIVIKNWNGQPKSRILTLQSGVKIALHGHLDMNEKFGTILIVESFQGLK